MDFIIEIMKHTDAPSIIIAGIALYLMNGTWKRTAERLEQLVIQNQKIIERNTAIIFALLSNFDQDKAKGAREILIDELGLNDIT